MILKPDRSHFATESLCVMIMKASIANPKNSKPLAMAYFIYGRV